MAALKRIVKPEYLPLLLSVVIFTGCEPSAWGFSRSERSGTPIEIRSLADIPLDSLDNKGVLNDLDNKGPGAAYCLGRVIEAGHPDKALILYTREAEKGSPLWKRESLYRLVLLLDKSGDSKAVLVWGWKARLDFPEDLRTLPYLIRHSFLEERYRDIPGLIADYPEPDPESQLYSLVSRAVLEKKSALPILEDAIYRIPLNQGYRAVSSALEKAGLSAQLPGNANTYLTGRLYMLDRQYGKALGLIEPALADTRLAETAPLIFDDYRLIRSGLPNRASGADVLAGMIPKLKNPASRRLAALGAVRLYRLEDLYLPAEEPARLALEASPEGKDRDEPLWQYLRVLLELDLNRFVSEAGLLELTDPSYFDDLFEMASVRIVQERRWELLPELWRKAAARGSIPARNHVAWITLLAVRYEFLDSNAVQTEELESWLTEHDRWGYRGLMTWYLSGSGRSLRKPVQKWFNPGRDRLPEPDKNSEMSEFFEALSRFGLSAVVVEEMLIRYGETPSETVRLCARFLNDAGEHYGAIRVLSRIFFEDWFNPTEEDLSIMYPLAYRELIESAANEFDVDPGLIFAVTRSESAFKADIVSHAGASGLMQLMPATAEERAGFLKLENYSVTDPETNLRMGTSHIRWLFERDYTTSPMDIMIAYNAGGGNLRKWKRRYEGLPPLLMAEALPPKETRDYIRKNLLALVIYDHLYFHKNPDTVIRNFFGL